MVYMAIVVFNSKSADKSAQGTVEFRGYVDVGLRDGFLIFEWTDRVEAYNASTIDTYVLTSEEE
jgi:hypothetical protein|tara:strand:- start:142 stop:333 length:192 start_codon:yes stop_codon:yes gene_type:complete